MSLEKESQIAATPPKSEKLDSNAWKVIAVVILAPFMTQMDSTVVNVSLSSITQDLHSTIAIAQWVISGYLLALALMLPINGWLVDRIGAKRLYLFCFSAFTLTSFLCGSAHSINELICARVAQGMAGGLLAPLSQLMAARVAGKQMVKVLGIASIPILLAPLFGPILAGTILKYASWHWLFYINLPIGIIAIILAVYFIPHDKTLIRKRPFDLAGFLMISPALVCLLYGFEAVSHNRSEGIWVLALGVVLSGAFIRYELRIATRALIDIGLFKNKDFSIAAVTQFLSNGIMYAGQFIVPLYLINECGLNGSQTGWILSSMGIGMLCIYPFAGQLTDRFGVRAVASGGVVLNFLGTLPFLWMAYNGFSMPLAIASLFVRGFGQGGTGVPSVAAAYASVPKEKLSFATTAINIVQRLGGPIMTTALAVFISTSGENRADSGSHSFIIPFIALIGFQLLVIWFTSRLPIRIHKDTIPT
ncbi:MAG: DHA2 family efflux MFS transporter permease subunit [Ignavibacteria bacterium]|nr:DHA2 family efflux MFS transporter permease subunit [Ignavibacteria bacterium]